jgi:uncharacterized surface protein with fasciclin (FAS1) repeats
MSTILQIANADRNLSTLIKGLKAADLEEVLSGIGPFTLLAPVNFAFSKLIPAELYNDLISDDNKIKLANIISFHLIAGRKMLRDFSHGQKIMMVNGQEALISVKDGDVSINGARILAKDRQGSNGVIHTVDSVNMPL